MQTQPESDSTSIDSVFYLIGFLSSLALTVFDFYTSYTGISSIALPGAEDKWKYWLPAVMSGTAITFVACSAIIIERFFKEQSPKTVMLMGCFIVSVLYDLVSSFLGTVAGMSGIESSLEAYRQASQGLLVFSAIAACLMMLGSFLVSKWFFLLKKSRGFIGKFFESFGG
jgi:uncharacterized membrane protein YwzB